MAQQKVHEKHKLLMQGWKCRQEEEVVELEAAESEERVERSQVIGCDKLWNQHRQERWADSKIDILV